MDININFSITEIQVSSIDINFVITEIQVMNIDINFDISDIFKINFLILKIPSGEEKPSSILKIL